MATWAVIAEPAVVAVCVFAELLSLLLNEFGIECDFMQDLAAVNLLLKR